jgi:hypothetical protein
MHLPVQESDALLQQLAQRQAAFSQLGSFMATIQSEAQSVEVWKTKLKVVCGFVLSSRTDKVVPFNFKHVSRLCILFSGNYCVIVLNLFSTDIISSLFFFFVLYHRNWKAYGRRDSP